MCFQILGLDIMIDQKLKPWLIEVNHLSSFGTDSPLDKKVKFDLIWDTLTLLNLSVKRKRKYVCFTFICLERKTTALSSLANVCTVSKL